MRTAALALVCAACLGAQAQDAPKVTIADIEKAWKEREEAFKEVEVEWEEEFYLPKGSLSRTWATYLSAKELKRQNPDGLPIPAEDATVKVRAALRLKGERMMLEHDEPQWKPAAKSLAATRIKSLNDGQRTIDFRPEGLSATTHPQGLISGARVFVAANHPRFRPITLSISPLRPSFRQLDIKELVVTGRTMKIGESLCHEVQRGTAQKAAPLTTYWVDPNKGHAVIRTTVHQATRVIQQIDIEYGQDQQGNWHPVAWKSVTNEFAGGLSRAITATLKKWQGTVGPALELPFPAGTRVTDNTLPEGSQDYIVKANQEKKTLTEEELKKPYKEVVDEMDSAGGPTRRLAYWLAIVLAGANLILTVLVALRFFGAPKPK